MTVATRLRIPIKSTDFLERASDIDTLILDKTGTVTVGAPVVADIQPSDGESEETLLSVAAEGRSRLTQGGSGRMVFVQEIESKSDILAMRRRQKSS
jgi:high-affinity K+ transport system ATPase subunit B